MNDLDANLRTLATKALATIAEMYPNSSIAKKLDGTDDYSYETLIGVWKAGLTGLTEIQVNHGITTLLNSGDTFEPPLPVFLKMCHSVNPPKHTHYVSLPAPKKNNSQASISHYSKSIKDELIRIGMTPSNGETQHEYAQRCRDYVNVNHGGYARVVGSCE